MSVKSIKTEESLQAKIIVLGDHQTGKSSLIRSLDPQCRQISQSNLSSPKHEQATTSFTVVEIPSEDLEGTSANVILKVWEFKGKGVQEEKIAFPGALFCIITLDMRAPETANSAFNKWVTVKETHMPEAFLFVVGTFLDDAAQRRVEVAEVCKACAQKEAIYVEVSNLDGSNVLLLKRLLCQRLNHMLRIREELGRPGRDAALEDDLLQSAEEAKHGGMAATSGGIITPSLLDQNILSSSVGSILCSALSLEKWQGFEAEQSNLRELGGQLSAFIDELSEGISDAPPPRPRPRGSWGTQGGGSGSGSGNSLAGGELHTALTEPDAEEMRHLFGIMGMSLPPSLQLSLSGSSGGGGYIPPKRVSVKVKVRLPDDGFSYLVLKSGDDVESAVLAFVAAHNMPNNLAAIAKLVQVGHSMLNRAEQEQEQAASSPTPASSRKPPAAKNNKPLKCKARVQLPDGQVIVTTVCEGEDAMSVSKRVAAEHGLSLGYQHKIWEQLQGALAALDSKRKTSTL